MQTSISILPKYAVSVILRFIEGESRMRLTRLCGEHYRKFAGEHFWESGSPRYPVGQEESLTRE